jgi:formylglycine-generating enzyme required for sulfatase activity
MMSYKDLGLDQASAQKILREVEERQEHLLEYRSAFMAELSDQLELSLQQQWLLQRLQAALSLDDAEIKQIEDLVLAERKSVRENHSPKPFPDKATVDDQKTMEVFSLDLGAGILLEMVNVTGGSFLMGLPAGQGFDHECPQHLVTVPEFFMGKYPVTQAQWRSIAALPPVKISLDPQPSHFKGADLQHQKPPNNQPTPKMNKNKKNKRKVLTGCRR